MSDLSKLHGGAGGQRDPADPGAGPPGHDAHDHGHGDHGGLAKYGFVFAALCVLTAASFFTYTDIWREHFGSHVGWAFMMAVSCTKAGLVILFFMHLKYEANWKYVLTIPAAMMSVFLCLMLVPDIGWRMYHYSFERWDHAAEIEPYVQEADQFYRNELIEPKDPGKEGL